MRQLEVALKFRYEGPNEEALSLKIRGIKGVMVCGIPEVQAQVTERETRTGS
jgi:hypothetical protein